jgi:transcriptional regulator with XRE-family HTH domain
MKHVGKEIYNIIKNKNIKQKDVAKMLNMSTVNLSKIFKKESIDASLLEKITKTLHISIEDFFNEEKSLILEEPQATYKAENKCANCARLEKIVAVQERLIDRLEGELEQLRKTNK